MKDQKEFEKLFQAPWSYRLFISHVAKLYKDRKIVHINITDPDSITLMFNVKHKSKNDQ